MKDVIIRKLIPIIAAAAAILFFAVWITDDSDYTIDSRIPGTDTTHLPPSTQTTTAPFKGTLTNFDGVPADLTGAWPSFRGSNYDNIATDDGPLAQKWDPQGPPPLWAIDVGEGYAGAAILAGRAYILDYDRKRKADVLRCLSMTDGKDIWQYAYRVKIKRNHGMSRTVPAVTEKHVVSIGPKCHVICLDSVTGQLR